MLMSFMKRDTFQFLIMLGVFIQLKLDDKKFLSPK